MFHTTWTRIIHARRQLALTVLAVVLGTTLLTAALILRDSTRMTLARSYAQAYAGADLVVRAAPVPGSGPFVDGPARLPADLVDALAESPGVAGVEGRIQTIAQLAADGVDEPAIAMGAPQDPGRAGIELRAGRLPAGDHEVAVDAAAAERLGIEVDDAVTVLLPDGGFSAEVVGTVGFGPLDALAGGARVVLDRQTAVGRIGDQVYSEILVRTAPPAAPAEVAPAISSVLDGDVVVLTAAEAARRAAAGAAEEALAVSRIVLAVAAVSLVVGGFLIANTLRMLATQRAQELALLRAIGASRRQVGTSLVIESALTGAVGAVLGAVLGIGVGGSLVAATGGLLPGMPPLATSVRLPALLAAPLVGVTLSVLASRSAVRRTLAVPPVAALREVATADPRPSRSRAVLGGALLAIGALVLGVGGRSLGVFPAAMGAALALLGVGLLFPIVAAPVLDLLSRPLTGSSVAASLAREQALAAPRRTGATAATLAVSLSLVVFLLTFGASLADAAPKVVDDRQSADIILRPTTRQGLHGVLFPIVQRVRQLDEVTTATVATYVDLALESESGTPEVLSVYSVDPEVVASLFDVRARQGAIEDLDDDAIAVRAAFAESKGWRVGTRIPATLPDGTRTQLLIRATFEGSISTNGIVAPAAVDAHVGLAQREAFIDVADGIATEPVVERIEGMVERAPVDVLDRTELAEAMASSNAGFFRLLAALLSLAVVIGILGVVNTLALAVVERIRELGLLRAVGATRRQIRSIVRWEAAMTGVLGATSGAVLGIVSAWVAIRSIPDLALPVSIPLGTVGLAVLATVLLGIVASSLPAARAARIDVLRAIEST